MQLKVSCESEVDIKTIIDEPTWKAMAHRSGEYAAGYDYDYCYDWLAFVCVITISAVWSRLHSFLRQRAMMTYLTWLLSASGQCDKEGARSRIGNLS